MKAKLFSKARIISAMLVLLTIGLVTGFAESTTADGCPEGTGGYMSKGNRKNLPCQHEILEKGYWWYIKGEVKWVGTIFADMKGSYQEGFKSKIIKGTEYSCDGYGDNICWVCNCYSLAIVEIE